MSRFLSYGSRFTNAFSSAKGRSLFRVSLSERRQFRFRSNFEASGVPPAAAGPPTPSERGSGNNTGSSGDDTGGSGNNTGNGGSDRTRWLLLLSGGATLFTVWLQYRYKQRHQQHQQSQAASSGDDDWSAANERRSQQQQHRGQAQHQSQQQGGDIDERTLFHVLMPSGNVERLEVLTNTRRVRVELRQAMPVSAGGTAHTSYELSIGDLPLFERHFDEAQAALGLGPLQPVPVRYSQDRVAQLADLLWAAVPTLAIVGLLVFGTHRLAGGLGKNNPFSMGRISNKKVTKTTDLEVRFKDVAGVNEAKQEVMEFVDFLKQPQKYKRLGAKLPRGALLVGPPGTGKTLLAKATAGEAGVPFFSVSGSDFIEMFVGVGPSRVRDLFQEAREAAPCIVFIDEIDAVGRARSKTGASNDERENTLNQLLVEMDGFGSAGHAVVVLAGTNRPDILDPALLRPGRFDRQITLDLPDLSGRRQIAAVHLKPLTLSEPLEQCAERLAELTVGFSGAELANVCNEAALIAARHGQTQVTPADLEAAIERVIAGLERRNRILQPHERRTVAYHEAGHAVAGWFLANTDPLLKVSIVPRGSTALGYAQYQPLDRHLVSRAALADRMVMMLGGRVAEQLFIGRISTGAADDLDKATKQAYAQVGQYGMSSAIGALAYPAADEDTGTLTVERPYSQQTARLLDKEARLLVQAAYARCTALLTDKRALLEQVAERLLAREILVRADLEALLGPRPSVRGVYSADAANHSPDSTAIAS
eukprot:TRINITY_DN470_c0_g1_i1.p1 TRINITY_DN470_c0_g1~~TRINITY_DN470_c0_g1_i1.p1  ORF type:complete len:763 (+),score=256.25 TRINITY_DN470_c0_g1_i1:100-2388(+)